VKRPGKSSGWIRLRLSTALSPRTWSSVGPAEGYAPGSTAPTRLSALLGLLRELFSRSRSSGTPRQSTIAEPGLALEGRQPSAEPRHENRPLRVVLYEPSGVGGFCHYTHQLAEALAERGCRVTVVTTSAYELESLPRHFRTMFLFRSSRTKRVLLFLLRGRRSKGGGPIVEQRNRQPRGFSSLRALRVRLLQLLLIFKLLGSRPDILHLQSTRHGRDLFLLRLLKLLRFRVVFTAHDLLPHDSRSASVWRAHKQVYGLVDRVIVHTESNRREMLEAFGVPRERIEVIPHGSYDLLLPNGRMTKAKARSEIGLAADARVILFFGLIKRYKGLEFLVQAFDQLEKIFPDAVLLVVGDVFRGDPDAYAFYSRLIEQNCERNNVHCVPRYVPIGEVGPYLSAADVVVLPYTKTYHSGVLLAAYAAARPVVVTRTGGLPELVEREKTGLVVPPRDPDSLARAIRRLLEWPELADEMGENASRLADSVYSWRAIATRTLQLYLTLMSEGRKHRRER
jgi:glycosyltransferase involved in cell wall biosynthesis